MYVGHEAGSVYVRDEISSVNSYFGILVAIRSFFKQVLEVFKV